MDANNTCAICGYGGLATEDGNDIAWKRGEISLGFGRVCL